MKTLFATFLLSFLFALSSNAGIYFEYKMTVGKKQSGTIKTWYQDGHSRSEVLIPGVPAAMGNMVAITRKDQLNKVFVLNEGSQTYMEMTDNEQKETEDSPSDMEISVLGTEKINGYNATHIQVKKKGAKSPEHFWLSKEIKGYQELNRLRGKYRASEDMLKKFEAKGVEGFPVKMTMHSEEGEIMMELTKAEETQIPNSKFSLDGYQKSSMPIGPAGMDLEKLKNMSPAERQKMVEEMMKQYGK